MEIFLGVVIVLAVIAVIVLAVLLIRFLFTNFIISRILSFGCIIASLIIACLIVNNSLGSISENTWAITITTALAWLFFIGPVVFDVEWDGTLNLNWETGEITPGTTGGVFYEYSWCFRRKRTTLFHICARIFGIILYTAHSAVYSKRSYDYLF